ncbi:hypothetical protein P9112_012495 [Eukaryota sp. TZLM1-RC]
MSVVRDTSNYSPLQVARLVYDTPIPDVLKGSCKIEDVPVSAISDPAIAKYFPHTINSKKVRIVSSDSPSMSPALRVGVVLSGGQAPGGHNCISGLFDGLKAINPESTLYGFLGGPSGILEQKYIELTAEYIAPFRNQGGFDIIGSGRTKIESSGDFAKAAECAKTMELDAIIVIGGDDSNTNAANLAEYFRANQLKTSVIGLPKTIDGDLKNKDIEISFGFHTACMVYSELIGNIQTDCNSAKKYYHFIRLMGRAASHIALECGLQTRPNMVIISEEVLAKNWSLHDVVNQIADMVEKRAEIGKNFGVILIPEGLIDFIPEISKLIGELNDILSGTSETVTNDLVRSKLSAASLAAFDFLPGNIQSQLMLDRDPHGNVQVSRIETERLLIELVSREMQTRQSFKGKFNGLSHFFGYEGRCSLPTNFDSKYCYVLGRTAAILTANGCTGMMAQACDLTKPTEEWIVGGVPIATMCGVERRKGKDVPVVTKALVLLEDPPFKYLCQEREGWALTDCYRNPGPIQFYGPTSEDIAVTLALERS